MKKLFLLFAMALTSIFAYAEGMLDRDYVAEWGRLTLKGNQLSSSKTGKAVQLRGWSSFGNYGENCVTGKNDILRMKGMGANCVRLARYLGSSGKYSDDKIKELVTACAESGMYVIIDWHLLAESDGSGSPTDFTGDAITFFETMANFVVSSGYENVIYEICNEPKIEDAAPIKRYAEELIPHITAIDRNKPVIIVGTPHWDQYIYNQTYQNNQMVNCSDANIMYAFHMYTNEDAHKSLLYSQFEPACKVMPVFVSEWGLSHAQPEKYNGDKRNDVNTDIATTFMAMMDGAAGQIVSWMNWSYGNKEEGSSTFTYGCQPGDNGEYLSKSGQWIVGILGGDIHVELPKSSAYQGTPFTLSAKSNKAVFQPYTFDVKEGEEGVQGAAMDVTYFDANNTGDENNDGGKAIDYDPFELVGRCSNGCNEKLFSATDGKAPQCYAGRAWCEMRSEECADVTGCAIDGEWDSSFGLGWISSGEWLNYTFQVNDPGYYMIEACVCEANGGYGKSTVDKSTGDVSYQGATSFSMSMTNHASQIFMVDIENSTETEEVALEEDEFACVALSHDQMVAAAAANKVTEETLNEMGSNNKSWTSLCQGRKAVKKAANYGVLFKEAGNYVVRISFPMGFNDNLAALRFTYAKPWTGEGYPEEVVDPTGIKNNSAAVNAIYPTVVEDGQFNVNVEGAAVVTITNMTGAVVYSQSINGASVIKANLAAGSYNVSVVSGADVINARIIVK